MKEFFAKYAGILGFVSNILVLVGGINWFFVGLLNVDLIKAILGVLLARLIYVIVGIAAGYLCYSMYMEKMKK